MAAALTVGTTRTTPASRSGQTAPKGVGRLAAQVARTARAHALPVSALAETSGLADPRLPPRGGMGWA